MLIRVQRGSYVAKTIAKAEIIRAKAVVTHLFLIVFVLFAVGIVSRQLDAQDAFFSGPVSSITGLCSCCIYNRPIL